MVVVLTFLLGVFFVGLAIIFIEDMVLKHRHSSGGCYKYTSDNKEQILVMDWNKNNNEYYIYNTSNFRTIMSGTKNVCESYLIAIGAVKIKKQLGGFIL